jgi:hypothetical protein
LAAGKLGRRWVFARRYGATRHHATRSRMMGNHPLAAIDDESRVGGMEGPRPIDPSIGRR